MSLNLNLEREHPPTLLAAVSMNGPFSFKRQPTKEEGETSMPLLPMLLNRERREHATGPIRIKWRRPEEGGRGIEW